MFYFQYLPKLYLGFKPYKNSGYCNRSFFPYGKVNGKLIITRVFSFYLNFFDGWSFIQ